MIVIFLYMPEGKYIRYPNVRKIFRQGDDIQFIDRGGKKITSVLPYTIEEERDIPFPDTIEEQGG